MNKITRRFIYAFVMITLMFGTFHNAEASSAPITTVPRNQVGLNESWTVTKSYVVDKGNVGGKGCNDNWTGTVDQPLCTVARGLTLVQPGEGLFLRAATYPSFTVTKSGASSGYITISSYAGEKAIVNGGYDAIQLRGASYVRIYGLEVTGANGNYGAGIHVTQGSGASPSFNIIENNMVHDNTGANTMGIVIENGSNNKVLNNKVYNNYLSGIVVISHTSNSPSGITGNEIVGNESYNNVMGGGDGDGIKLEGSGTKNTLIMNNISHNNSDDGIDTWNSSHNIIVGNISYGQTGPGDGNGFKLGGGGTGGYNFVKQNIAYGNKFNGFDANGTGGNVYYNNVAYNNNYGFEDGWKEGPCESSTFINNIGYNNTRGNFVAGAYTAVSHNNLWFSDGGSAKVLYDYATYSSLTAFHSASGNRLDNPSGGDLASIQADPQFSNAPGGVFTLLPSSPAIDRGDTANPGQITAISRVDIGAFEYSGGQPPIVSTPTPTAVPPTVTPELPTAAPTLVEPTPTPTLTAEPPTATPTSMPTLPSPTPTLTAELPTAAPTDLEPSATPTEAPFLPSPTTTLPAELPTATAQATSQVLSEIIYDDSDAAFIYSRGWSDVAHQQAYNGSYKVSNNRRDSITLNFTGQSFSIIYTGDPSFRKMDIYVDDVYIGTINQQKARTKYQLRWDSPRQFTYGNHTLKLVVNSRKNTHNSIDQVIVR